MCNGRRETKREGGIARVAPWARAEMMTADLEDKRLTARLIKLLEMLGERPTPPVRPNFPPPTLRICGAGWVMPAYRRMTTFEPIERMS